MLENLAIGFGVALSPSTLVACLIGAVLGTFVGVLPGVGALAGISLLLPLTFSQTPLDAIVMLSGIYFGIMYGGSTGAILLNLPGSEPSAVVALDGYPMAKQGRAGVALTITTIASFVGGCFSIILVMGFAAPLVKVALQFKSVEYFSLVVLGLVAASSIAASSPIRGLIMVVIGLLLGLVGIDIQSGYPRFTMGSNQLFDGVGLVVVAMGLFGVSEILTKIASRAVGDETPTFRATWRALLPSRSDWKSSALPMGRGSLVGAGIGLLPGAGAVVASFISYSLEKRISKKPEKFGRGAIEGIASAEAANNAAAQSAFIPTLALGIPGSATMALILGTLMIHGIQPGPRVISENPELFWGVVASFWIGNAILLILNLPLIGLWVRILRIPYEYLYPAILFFICFGAYTVSKSTFDVFLTIGFGVLGYFARRLDLPAAPLLLGLVLGPMAEEHLRRALLLSKGDYTVFVSSPISAVLLSITLVILIFSILPSIRRLYSRKKQAGRA